MRGRLQPDVPDLLALHRPSGRLEALELIQRARTGAPYVYLGTPEHDTLIHHTDVPPGYWKTATPHARWIFLTEYTYP